MSPIAPHQNCEVRLVLSGTKPLGSIEKGKDPYGYSLACALSKVGMLNAFIGPTRDSEEGEAIFVLPQNKHLIERFK